MYSLWKRKTSRFLQATTAVIIAVILNLSLSSVALADQADPDSTPTVDFDVYRNLLETGDFLLLIYANIPYASTPDDDVAGSFIWVLYDTDNVTELGTDIGYVYQASGYGYNVYSMYFSAADAPTWGLAYSVSLQGNPSVFDDPPVYEYQLSSGDYTTLTASADVQSELEVRLLTIAADLNVRWSLDEDYWLTTDMETGTFLSIYGSNFFRGAIYGVQGLAPGIFSFQVGEIVHTNRSWSNAYATNISSQYAGTWVATAQTGGANLFNKSYDLTSLIMALTGVIAVFLLGLAIARNAWFGLLDAIFLAVVFARLNFIELSFLAMLAGVAWLYVSAKTWGLVR